VSGQVLGIDLGGTKVVAAGLRDRALGESVIEPTETSSSDALIAQLVGIVQRARSGDLRAVGIGTPSVVDFESGRAVSSVNVPLADVPLRALLGDRLGVPVFVDNDATVAALAEAHDEQFRPTARNLIMFTVGTGVGGGIVLGGRIYRGATGAAGELGHMIVGMDLAGSVPAPMRFPQPGSLEFAASGHALDALATQAAGRHPRSPLGRLRAEGRPVLGADAVEAAQAGRGANGRAVGPAPRDRDRERNQHLRPRGGRHRRRRCARRGPPADARQARCGPIHAPWRRAPDDDPPRPPWSQVGSPRCSVAGRPRARGGEAMRIACGFDHAGFPLRERLLAEVAGAGHEVLDLGTDSPEPVDYPVKALEVGRAVVSGAADRGIIVCGSGAGVSVAACKIRGVRASTIHDAYTAHQAVEHDDVNVLCLGGRVIGVEVAAEIVKTFLAAEVSQEERHARRRAMVDEIERTGGG